MKAGAIGTKKDKFSNRNNYQTGIKYVKFALTLDLFPIYQQIDVSEAKNEDKFLQKTQLEG